MAPRWLRVLPLLALGTNLATMAPARALVPYAYLPQRRELEGAGLGIAQAAARLLQLGQAQDAARLAALTVQLLPADPRGWLLLAESQLRSQQLAAAAVSLARAKDLDPANAGIWFAEASLALRDERPAEAIELLNEGLKRDSRNASAYFDLGNAHILLNQPGQALAAFERAARLRKDFWEAINNQGLVLYEQGQADRAIERWRRVCRSSPMPPNPTWPWPRPSSSGGLPGARKPWNGPVRPSTANPITCSTATKRSSCGARSCARPPSCCCSRRN